jgi:hypothetical protein
MTLPSITSDKALRIYLALIQYPILSTQIRANMRRELFASGIISQQAFEAEVREQAIKSQAREALHNPFFEEPADVGNAPDACKHQADFYFPTTCLMNFLSPWCGKPDRARCTSTRLLVSFNPENCASEHALRTSIRNQASPNGTLRRGACARWLF